MSEAQLISKPGWKNMAGATFKPPKQEPRATRLFPRCRGAWLPGALILSQALLLPAPCSGRDAARHLDHYDSPPLCCAVLTKLLTQKPTLLATAKLSLEAGFFNLSPVDSFWGTILCCGVCPCFVEC